MKSQWLGIALLTFSVACVRLGYDPLLAATDPDQDSSTAAAVDGGNRMDAASPDAAANDGAVASDSASMDGTLPALEDGSIPRDAEVDDRKRDAAVSDAGGTPCDAHPGALFCDGFEDPDLANWSYTVFTHGSAERSTALKRSGDASLRAHTGAANGAANEARYGVRVFDHQKSGDLWLRYFYYLPSSTVVNTNFSSGVIAEIEPPYFGFSLLIRNDHVAIASGGTFYEGTLSFPRDAWTCVELHVKVDATSGVFEAFLDRTLAAISPATDTVPVMGYTTADLGIHYTDTSQGPVEAYVDDVVAATSRVDCD